MKTLILILLLPAMVFATEINNPLNVLSSDELEIKFIQKWNQQEKEYEDANQILDERDYSTWISKLQVGLGFWQGISIRLGTEMVYGGVLRKTFAPGSTFTNQQIDYRGLRSGSLSLQYYSPQKDLAFELYGETSILRARENNGSLGGTDAGMKFKYRHHIGHTDIYGSIFTEVEGKKRQRRYDGEKEVIDPYTKFGSDINFRRNGEK